MARRLEVRASFPPPPSPPPQTAQVSPLHGRGLWCGHTVLWSAGALTQGQPGTD